MFFHPELSEGSSTIERWATCLGVEDASMTKWGLNWYSISAPAHHTQSYFAFAYAE